MPRIRQDIATLGGDWSDTLLWYARAITEMQGRGPAQRTSWAYLAAMHGIDRNGWIQAGVITAGDPLPPAAEQAALWNQCQHGGWYFLPWHRGYLAAFEDAVAATVASLGGPADWALPYWNYLNAANPLARHIPQALLDPTMPDGSPNPLSAPPRGGTQILGPQPWLPRDITLGAMDEHRFTASPFSAGFGGGDTGGFTHFGNLTGAEESDPHNLVHVMIGGTGASGPPGFMSDPDYAALDPIFWLHHCNVDRMWAAWLATSGNIQENGAAWSNGPFPRRFQMPDPAGNLHVFTPADTLPDGALAPTYDDLWAGTTPDGAMPASLDATEEDAMPATLSSEEPPATTLMGANSEAVTVGAGTAVTSVQLDPAEADVAGVEEQRVFLNLENVRGAAPSGVLDIYVSLPASGAMPAAAPEHVESLALFGLAKASRADGDHAGNGLSFAIDITALARSLAQASGAALEQLDVQLRQPGSDEPITVERVSVYKQPLG